MKKFFKDILLEESAIYTLWGSKPITKIDIFYHSDEEMWAFYEQMDEEDKKNAIIIEDYDLPLNWEKWEKICEKLPINQYLIFEKKNEEDNKFAAIYFVNIASTVQILKENYAIFSEKTGMQFDPDQVVLEMQNKSPFWDKVQNNGLLVGLLYGFGFANALGFTEKYRNGYSDPSTNHFSDDHTYGTTSIEKFPIPIFASFADGKDEVIERYKEEREKIQKIYKNQDFVELTLRKLTEH